MARKSSPPSDVPQVDHQLDLSGEVCPYTFVKSKLALESLEPGKVLHVIVDNSESASNVPRSLELEGHEVVHLSKSKPVKYHIYVRKAGSVTGS